jgi:hypothetical protein
MSVSRGSTLIAPDLVQLPTSIQDYQAESLMGADTGMHRCHCVISANPGA